ncbi:MAG: hypothetical protein NVS2B2_37540 [Ktedonobacteraceae bacterium]
MIAFVDLDILSGFRVYNRVYNLVQEMLNLSATTDSCPEDTDTSRWRKLETYRDYLQLDCPVHPH